MTRKFNIKDAKPGDMLVANNPDDSLAQKWLVLSNHCEDDYMGRYVEVYIMYSQSPHEERFSFYYTSFNGQTYQRMDWRLEQC